MSGNNRTTTPRPTAGRVPPPGIGGPGALPGEVDALNWTVTVERALGVLSRKWVVTVLRSLQAGPKRQFQIRADARGIQQKVLRETLRALRDDGIVKATMINDGGLDAVAWELTHDGESLLDVVAVVYRWSRDHLVGAQPPHAY
ncbi:MAG: winged helix-turn-helix transcriptional regulator [Vicinamibacterales bacterium]